MTTKVKNSVYHYRAPVKDPNKESLHKILSDEDSEDFYNYLDWLDLSNNPNIIVIPLSNHFFYQPEDFEEIEMVANLKCLNHIRNMRAFLESIYRYMPGDCFFTGCFAEAKNNKMPVQQAYNGSQAGNNAYNQSNYGLPGVSGLFTRLNSILNTKINTRLKKESVKSILSDIGFTIHDMTELNGITYFCAQKRLRSG
ncbi:MAG: hypothetical protein ACQERS_05370 [Bacteroidota bacterium]